MDPRSPTAIYTAIRVDGLGSRGSMVRVGHAGRRLRPWRGLTGEGLSTRSVYPLQSLVRCGSRRSGQNYARPESTSAPRDYAGKTLDLTELSERRSPVSSACGVQRGKSPARGSRA